MVSNHNKALNKAIRERDAEYYTLYNDIADELPHYREQLRGKRIICPCDWDESYNEEIVFLSETAVKHSSMYGNGSIKNIDIPATKHCFEKEMSLIKCNFVKFLVAHAETYGIESISVSGYDPMTGKGVRFQDVDYSKYDLVITNPPFNQFAEFVLKMINSGMEFIIIGPYLAPYYSDVFPLFMQNKIWSGYARELSGFMRPDGSLLMKNDGAKGSNARGSRWYTNLDVSLRHDKVILTKKYSPDNYPKALNYDAIFVGSIANIPYDYEGEMIVTINMLPKINPEQFEVIGNSGTLAKPIIIDGKKKTGRFYLPTDNKPKRLFDYMVVVNKCPIKDEEE